MKRASKGYSGVNTLLFQTMLVQDHSEEPKILVAAPIPHDSPLPRVHSLGSDEGSLSLNELTVLCTLLSKKVESLESKLKQTKQTYSTALTKLIKRVKKLKHTVKTSQARRRAKVVISDAEEDEEDPSKQERSLIEELDLDAGISLPPHVADQGRFDDTQVSDQPKEKLGAAKVLADAAEQRRDIENVQTYTRRIRVVSTGSGGVSTASRVVSTAGVKAKYKGKAVMQESDPPKKIKKRVQVQMNIDEELAQKVHEEEQARFNAEQEAKVVADKDFVQQLQAGEKVSDEDLPRKLVELVNQRKKLFAQQRAEAKRNKPMTHAQQKEYMSTYIKNQEGGYTLKQLKALSFEEVKEIFEATMRKNLVKERSRTTEPTKDKARELWVELKRLFEPDDNDTLWKLQRYMHDPLNWWLYDTCGVSIERGHDIYMLVKKDYPLTKALATLMLCNKLRVEQYSDMADELL
ncbi:hypothetical protein Tco_0827499 [Tanacetum coccineum]